MGWLLRTGCTRRDLIDERSKNWEQSKDDGTVITTTCLAHCYRGGAFSGVLWCIWGRTVTKDGQQVEPSRRRISCDLLRYEGGQWGYKDLDESMHPYYYSCPLKYLDLVPIEQFGGNAEWRALVQQYHAQAAEKRRAGRKVSNSPTPA